MRSSLRWSDSVSSSKGGSNRAGTMETFHPGLKSVNVVYLNHNSHAWSVLLPTTDIPSRPPFPSTTEKKPLYHLFPYDIIIILALFKCTSSQPCVTSSWGCRDNTPCIQKGPLLWCRQRRPAPAPSRSEGNPTKVMMVTQLWQRYCWCWEFWRRPRGSAGSSRTLRWRFEAQWRSRPPRQPSPDDWTGTDIQPPAGSLSVNLSFSSRHRSREPGDRLPGRCCGALIELGSRRLPQVQITEVLLVQTLLRHRHFSLGRSPRSTGHLHPAWLLVPQ